MTDAILVRAPIGSTYRVLTDIDAWPRWLPGCRSNRLADPPGASVDGPQADRHRLVLPGLRRPVRLEISSFGWRHDAGLRWDVRWSGWTRGGTAAEWWLEEVREGAVVHHLIHGTAQGSRDPRGEDRYRRCVMFAMQTMKDHLELAVAHAAGRVP